MFNVICENCQQIFEPTEKSPAWWKAKKAADRGRLDAIGVSGIDCGCLQPIKPSPFLVFGYDGMCVDFRIPCNTFVEAIKTYREMCRYGHIVFVEGISYEIQDKIQYPSHTH